MNKEKFSHLPLDWQRAISAFLDDRFSRSGSDATRTKYRYILAKFFTDHPEPNEVTRNDVGEFIRKPGAAKGRVGQPVSAATRNCRRSIIQQIFAYSTEYEIAPGKMLFEKPNPARFFHDVKVGLPDKSMSQEQVARFFAAIDRSDWRGKMYFAIFLFYFLTARRREEVARLRVRDIEEVILTDGTTRRSGYRFHFRNKGASRVDDSQELPQLVHSALVDYWKASGRYDTLRADDPLFVSQVRRDGRKVQLTSWWINKKFKAIARAASLPATLTLHSLRHASSRARAEQGESISSISKILRHSSLAITTRYLSGLVTDEDKGAALLANLPFLASGKEASRG